MTEIRMKAHIIVTKDGSEWMIYGWSGSGHPAAAPIDNATQMLRDNNWVLETGDRHMDIEFTLDVPEALPTVELKVTASG